MKKIFIILLPLFIFNFKIFASNQYIYCSKIEEGFIVQSGWVPDDKNKGYLTISGDWIGANFSIFQSEQTLCQLKALCSKIFGKNVHPDQITVTIKNHYFSWQYTIAGKPIPLTPVKTQNDDIANGNYVGDPITLRFDQLKPKIPYRFVQKLDGSFVFGAPNKEWQTTNITQSHGVLNNFKEALSAGYIWVDNSGTIIQISSHSGHYTPTPEHLQYAVYSFRKNYTVAPKVKVGQFSGTTF